MYYMINRQISLPTIVLIPHLLGLLVCGITFLMSPIFDIAEMIYQGKVFVDEGDVEGYAIDGSLSCNESVSS